jgi:hypothetical protein
MATETIALVEVGMVAGDTYEEVSFRSCDFCFESAMQDIWANREVRKFYQQQGGVDAGLVREVH